MEEMVKGPPRSVRLRNLSWQIHHPQQWSLLHRHRHRQARELGEMVGQLVREVVTRVVMGNAVVL